jgi:hypothetical protein
MYWGDSISVIEVPDREQHMFAGQTVTFLPRNLYFIILGW